MKKNEKLAIIALAFLLLIICFTFAFGIRAQRRQLRAVESQLKAERELIETEQSLSVLLKATQRSVVLVTIANRDGHGVIKRITGAAEDLFGWDEDELNGKPVEILMAPQHRVAHRRGLQKLILWIESEIESGRDVDAPVQAIRCFGFTKDEEQIPVLVVTSFAGIAETGEILMLAMIYDADGAKIIFQKE